MKNYTYILFDWDGCLAQTLRVWMDAYKTALSKYGVNPTEQEIAFHFGDWELPKRFGIEDNDGCLKIVDQIVDEDLRKVALYDGAANVLKELSKTRKLALVSSSLRKVLVPALKFNDISGYFEVVLTGEDVTNHKPDPEVINKALEKLNGSKNEAIMIGDSRKDIEAASRAGIDSILVYPKSHTLFYDLAELKKYNPTYTVDKLNDILDILK